MSQYDRTIIPKASFQAGVGQAATSVEVLDAVRNIIAYKGVWIKNTNASAEGLLIGYGNVPPAFELAQGETIFLEIRDPDTIKVAAKTATCDYTWLAY